MVAAVYLKSSKMYPVYTYNEVTPTMKTFACIP